MELRIERAKVQPLNSYRPFNILDNHGKVLTETVGADGEIHIKRYAPQENY
jgi:hypothetical protein